MASATDTLDRDEGEGVDAATFEANFWELIETLKDIRGRTSQLRDKMRIEFERGNQMLIDAGLPPIAE